MTRSPAVELQVEFLHPYYLYTLAVAAVTTAVGPYSYSVQVVTATARELQRIISNKKLCEQKVKPPAFMPIVAENGQFSTHLLHTVYNLF